MTKFNYKQEGAFHSHESIKIVIIVRGLYETFVSTRFRLQM